MSIRLVILALLALASPALAEKQQQATFALIIGVNKSVDAELPELRYADDDAARYLDLFRGLGARTYLLTRPDDNTRRVHPQATAEAQRPAKKELAATVEQLARDIGQAKARGLETVLYVIYSGHGNVKDGQGYISLEDARLTGTQLSTEVVTKIDAARTHVIVDACYSVFLAVGRGAGGKRRPVSGFSKLQGLSSGDRVGLLFSTSSARESHEWEAVQAGVFSHEVRSGLYGAADIDGDGLVSYREIAAFVERANAAIPNERFRPDVFARAPEGSDLLVDLRDRRGHRIEIDRGERAHYLLEDARGVRVAELHAAAGQVIRLATPATAGLLYLHRLDDDQEFVITPTDEVTKLTTLVAQASRTSARGGAHAAFSSIFTLPFDAAAVAAFQFRPLPSAEELADELAAPRSPRRRAGWISLGIGGGLLTSALATSWSATRLRDGIRATDSQATVEATNRKIERRNLGAGLLYGAAGAAVLTGAALLLWPDATSSQRAIGYDGSTLSFSTTF